MELDYQRAIVDLYKRTGCVVYQMSQRRRLKHSAPPKGIPDLWVFCPVRHVAWWHEVKTATGKLRPEQEQFRVFCEVTQQKWLGGGMEVAEAWLRRLKLLEP